MGSRTIRSGFESGGRIHLRNEPSISSSQKYSQMSCRVWPRGVLVPVAVLVHLAVRYCGENLPPIGPPGKLRCPSLRCKPHARNAVPMQQRAPAYFSASTSGAGIGTSKPVSPSVIRSFPPAWAVAISGRPLRRHRPLECAPSAGSAAVTGRVFVEILPDLIDAREPLIFRALERRDEFCEQLALLQCRRQRQHMASQTGA